MELHWNQFSIEFELQWNNCSWNGLLHCVIMTLLHYETGTQSMAIWIHNSEASNITLYIHKMYKLRQGKFIILESAILHWRYIKCIRGKYIYKICMEVEVTYGYFMKCISRDQSRYVPSQWETSLHCNNISHWLGTNLDWSLHFWLMVSYNESEWMICLICLTTV